MNDLYDQAADMAAIPDELRAAISAEVAPKATHQSVDALASLMHEAIMERRVRSFAMDLAHFGTRRAP